MGVCTTAVGELLLCTLQPNAVSKVTNENRVYESLTSLNKYKLEPFISLPTFSNGGKRPRSLSLDRKNNRLVVSFVGQSVDRISVYQL